MPLRLEVRRKLLCKSDRVKCVDLHPIEPWMLCSLYNGHVHVWNYETQLLVKSFEVCDVPVRCAKFVPRKNWIISGSDDMQIRVLNYNTLEREHIFEAHTDYLRCIAVHSTQPYILTSSDDMFIKLWNWEKNWACTQVFDGHTHYVMQIVINPKDNNTFASASLDRTVKVWQLGCNTANITLEGHEKGVNCVDYCHSSDKPYLISGADDRTVKIWDYQTKTCLQTLEGHAQNLSSVCYHPELPIIITGSEDGTVKIWHLNTYELENTLNYSLERVWAIAALKGSNNLALGYDEGSIVVKLGREEPAISMDNSGKIVWARHSELQQSNIKAISDNDEIKDGVILPLNVKDMGSCEIYPQTISHNSNGRFVVVCGDGEYIIYTALTLRNKSFGSAQEFVWALDSSEYAVRENTKTIKIFKNFKEKESFKPEFGAQGIYGGFMLGVKTQFGLALYDWENLELIRRIEIEVKNVYWSDSGELCCISTEDSFFILKYNIEEVEKLKKNRDESQTIDGYDDAFDVVTEIQESVKTGLWISDCFIYTNGVNRLNYYVGGEIVTIAHLDRPMYLLGYLSKENCLYLSDKELNIVSYSLLLSVLEYQTAVMRQDFEAAEKILPSISKEQRTRVAHFLEKQGFKHQALSVSTDPEHKFDLALQLQDTEKAYELAIECQTELKWRQLADLAMRLSKFELSQECLEKIQDLPGLLLLATSSGDREMVYKLADLAKEKNINNISFLSYLILGETEKALQTLIDTDHLPEAAFFARTYLPSQITYVTNLWKESVIKKTKNEKSAQALANPDEYENLFPDYVESLKIEENYRKIKESNAKILASSYSNLVPNDNKKLLDEISTEKSYDSEFKHSDSADSLEEKLKNLNASDESDEED